MKKHEARRIAELNMKEILQILNETDRKIEGERSGVVIATYTAEEFAELKHGEDYELFKLVERYVIEDLAAEGIKNVFFQQVDSVEYYKFIAENDLENSPASIAYFANVKYMQKMKGSNNEY